MSVSCNLAVLLCKALRSVYHNNAYIGSVYSHISTKHAVLFYLLVYLGLAADSCRINKHIFLTVTLNARIDSVTGSTCDIRHYHSLLARNFIYKRRFTRIRLTDDRNLDSIL